MGDDARVVLVVEDDLAVREALARALRLDGYTVETASDGPEGLARVEQVRPDAVLLDVTMPGLDGLEVCRRLRAAGDRTPVLMLTARETVTDRVAGLDAGADDYLVKPFALAELRARLRALLRRHDPVMAAADGAALADGDTLAFGDLVLDLAGWTCRRGDRPIELTRTEFQILEVFLLNPGQVLPREVVSDRVWGYDVGPSSNALDVYIGYLRRKTEAGGEPRLLQTVRGVGYVLRQQ